MRKVAFLTCFAFMLSVGLASAQEVTLDQIVANHLDALGGKAQLEAVNSVKMTGEMNVAAQGIQAPMTMYFALPNKMRMEINVMGMQIVQGNDGETAWMINPMMGPDPQVVPQEDENADTQTSAVTDLLNYTDRGWALELVGEEEVEGAAAYKLKLTKKDGKEKFLFLDKEYFITVKEVEKQSQMGQEFEAESYASDYKEVGGILMPHAITIKSGGQTQYTMTISSIELNPAVEASLFSMPGKN